MKFVFTILAVAATYSIASFATECKQMDSIRVETVAQLQAISDVCVVSGALSIFIDSANPVDLPLLQSARFINIEGSQISGVFLPKLAKANYLRVSGSSIKSIEVPSLAKVRSTLVIEDTGIVNLDLVNLNQLNTLWVVNNSELEEIFTPRLPDLNKLVLDGNTELSFENLKAIEALVSNQRNVPSNYEIEESRRASMILAVRRYRMRTGSSPHRAATFGKTQYYPRGWNYRRYRSPRYYSYYPRIRLCSFWPWGYC